jgi:hypothetical protein
LTEVQAGSIGWNLPQRLEIVAVNLERNRLGKCLEVFNRADQSSFAWTRAYGSDHADPEVHLRLKTSFRTPSAAVVDERFARVDDISVPRRILVRDA